MLREYWGYDHLRPKQRQIIETLTIDREVIGLLPTGGGKSICYQVPALLLEGLTIVISPLVSLMDDQVAALKSHEIAAERIHSGLTKTSIDRILDNCVLGQVKMLYVSPERLHTDLFLHRMEQCCISMIAIDEAHCISQWGHDFRPSYLSITKFLSKYDKAKVIALTASATPDVLREIKENLEIPSATIIRDSFARDNIAISIRVVEDKLNTLRQLITGNRKSLIYCRSRRQVQMIADLLSSDGVSAAYYHAGLSYRDKQKILESYTKGKLQCVAATNAFGMGVDISDIQQVIHYDVPPSVEEYYQEIGRAGRDGKESSAVLLYQKRDAEFHQKQLALEFPAFEEIMKTYRSLCVHYGVHVGEGAGQVKSIDVIKTAKHIKLLPKQLFGRLRSLSLLGLLQLSEQSKDLHLAKITQPPRVLRQSRDAQRYPDLMDMLMRLERIYDEWVELPVDRMSRRLDMSTARLVIILAKIGSSGTIKYYHRPAGTVLSWLVDRVDRRTISSYQKNYEAHHLRKQDRVAAVQALLDSDTCMMNVVLQYFGEWRDVPCGSCDNCQRNNDHSTTITQEAMIKYQRMAVEGYVSIPESWQV